jgi:hypothetical protein
VIKAGALLSSLCGVVLAAACSSGSKQECVVGADCASGACDVSGHCIAAPPQPDSGAVDSSMMGDDASTSDVFVPPPDGSGCTANKDGTIDRAEVPLEAGLRATYRIAENATVSTAGTTRGDGSRAWDLSGALGGDHDVIVETLAMMGTWYAADFTSASYATKLSDTADLLGVFETSATALSLLGVVSPSSGTTQTKLTYTTPIPTLSFPFHVGSMWNAMSNVSGTAQGVASFYTESYANKVDAFGDMKTPYGTFRVQRVSSVLTRTVGALPTVTRTFVFIAECFGPVATIVSQSNETTAEFTSAAEVRRLAP